MPRLHASWAIALAIILLVAIGAPSAAQARIARTPNPQRGSCDGLLDYASELRPGAITLVQQTDKGGGIAEVELFLQLLNLERGQFRAASAFPQVEVGNALGILTDPAPLAAEFGPIDPLGSAASTASLVLQLPAANVAALIDQLRNGTLPISVHADEEPVYAPHVTIRNWDPVWDGRFRVYPPNFMQGAIGPDYEPPYEPGAIYQATFVLGTFPTVGPNDVPTYRGDAPDGFGSFQVSDFCPDLQPDETCQIDGEPLYLTPGSDFLYGIPVSMQYARVLSVASAGVYLDGGVYAAIVMTLQRTDQESIPDLVESGSFCTSPAHQVDPPVAETRVHELDGYEVDPDERDGHAQQIRFNFLPWWAGGRLSLSGQIGCHVLKPSLALRIRDGHVESEAGFDTDCSMTAEMRAYDDIEVDEFEDPIEMWSTCFPLPNLPAGPVGIPMTIQLKHLIDVTASASAGAVVGFTKHWDSGFSIDCQGGPGVAEMCSSESHREPTPIQFTPPQLAEPTNVSVEAKTSLQAALRVGFESPFCDAGPGITVESNAWGRISANPLQDPWWSTGFGLDLVGGFDLGVFGLGMASVQTDLFAIEEDVDAGGPLLGSALGGGSARSSAQGSASVVAPSQLVSGADQRWAVAVDDTALVNGVNVTGVAALSDGSSFAVTSEPTGDRSALVKLDRFGAFQWAMRYADPRRARRVRALPDDTLLVGATPAYLARHDADGNLLFGFDAEVVRPDAAFASCSLRDVVALEQPTGAFDFVVVGVMEAGTTAVSTDGCAFRVNADGSVAWARFYGEDGVQEFLGATATSDGNIAIAGQAHGELRGNRRFPLVAKIDPATGDVIWWRGLAMMRTGRLNSIVEGSGGTLFAAGTAQRIIFQTGAALVARIEADGSGARHGMIFQDGMWESIFSFGTREATVAGETAYDEFFDIAPVGDGFVLAGRSGLGTATEAWVARINAKLGLEWYRALDGAGTDSMGGVAVAGNGIFVSGYSASLPEPDGPNTGESQLLVMKLPFTGSVDLTPEAGVVTRYVQPGVRFSSDDAAITGGLEGLDATVDFDVTDAVVASAGSSPGTVGPAASYCAVRLTESGHPSTLDACGDDADLDGIEDALDNCVEIPNPTQADANSGEDDDTSLPGVQHYGDACDADLDDDGTVGASDFFGVFRTCLGADLAARPECRIADLDGDGLVGSSDFFGHLRPAFGTEPGPGVDEGP